MKIKQWHILLAILLLTTTTIGCKDSDENKDTQPPAQITNISFTANNGGGYFLYTIPQDPDFLYVRADYTLDNGKTVSKTSSTYSDTLYIEGLGQVKEYLVKLFTVDRSNNVSLPVEQRITPLESNTLAVLGTVNVLPGFSSLIINWESHLKQNIDICVDVKIGDKKALKIFSSNIEKDRFSIKDLEGAAHSVTVYVKDSYGNTSETKDYGEVTPLTDGKLSKKGWSFLRNNLLYGNKWDYASNKDPNLQTPLPEHMGTFRSDSLKNAAETAYEGRIEKFWDDEYDDNAKRNLNYFNTGDGQSYPFSYFIDLGRVIQASRFALWQRNNAPYGGENVEICELWVSNDQDPTDGIDGWEYIGTYKITKPSDPILAKNEATEGHHFDIFPDKPEYTKPFRYIRYKATKCFTNANTGCMSEITIYGIETNS